MKKIGVYLLYSGALAFALGLIYTSVAPKKDVPVVNKSEKNISQNISSKPAEKIQIFMFHSSNRCFSCVTIGQFTKKTIEQKFPEKLKSGKIEFKEINVDLPENKEIATKFKAVGSSLFINPIADGKDNIKEDVRVWRLVSNEQSFIEYLSGEIKKLL